MRNSSAISAIIPRTRARILAPMVMNPRKPWFLTELARHLGARHTTIQRELSALARAGILLSWRDGGRRYYRVDESTPIFPELSRLLIKTVGLVDILRQALKPLEDRIDGAFIFGSLATQTDTAHSDVDLLVVGEVGLFDLSPAIKEVEAQVLRPVNPVIYSRREFLRRIRSRDHFVTSVLAKDTLVVLGRMDDLVGQTSRPGPRRPGKAQSAGSQRPPPDGRPRSRRRQRQKHLA